MTTPAKSALMIVFALATLVSPSAQQPPAAPGAPQGRGRGGGFRQPDPIDFDEHDGWTSLFDGKTLSGWSGDSNWKGEDGAMRIEGTGERSTGTTYSVC